MTVKSSYTRHLHSKHCAGSDSYRMTSALLIKRGSTCRNVSDPELIRPIKLAPEWHLFYPASSKHCAGMTPLQIESLIIKPPKYLIRGIKHPRNRFVTLLRNGLESFTGINIQAILRDFKNIPGQPTWTASLQTSVYYLESSLC
jgi:hypothetical protein